MTETSSTQQLDFMERDGVEYAFMPSKTFMPRFGFMRFKPGVSKARKKNSRELVRKFTSLQFVQLM